MSRTLLLVGGVLFTAAAAETMIAFGLHSPSDGANIGGGIAAMSAVAAFIAALLGAFLLDRAASALIRLGVTAVGVLALLFSVQGVVLVAFGIAEEL